MRHCHLDTYMYNGLEDNGLNNKYLVAQITFT